MGNPLLDPLGMQDSMSSPLLGDTRVADSTPGFGYGMIPLTRQALERQQGSSLNLSDTAILDEKKFADAWKEFLQDPIKYAPFISLADTIIDAGQLLRDAQAFKAGTATPEQEARLKAHVADQARPTSWGYKVGMIMRELPAFAGEFMASGALLKFGGKKLAQKATSEILQEVGRYFAREGVEDAATMAAKYGGLRAAASVTGRAAAEALPRSAILFNRAWRGTIQNMMPDFKLTETEAGEIIAEIENGGDDFWDALGKSYLDLGVEVFSEQIGEHLDILKYALGKTKAGSAVKMALLNRLSRKAGSQTQGFLAGLSQSLRNIQPQLRRMGWNGILGELYEERVGDTIRGLTGLQPMSEIIPSLDQLTAEAVAFAVNPMVIGGVAKDQLTDRMSVRRYAENTAEINDFSKPENGVQVEWDLRQRAKKFATAFKEERSDTRYAKLLRMLPNRVQGVLGRFGFSQKRAGSTAELLNRKGLAAVTLAYDKAEEVAPGTGEEAVYRALQNVAGIIKVDTEEAVVEYQDALAQGKAFKTARPTEDVNERVPLILAKLSTGGYESRSEAERALQFLIKETPVAYMLNPADASELHIESLLVSEILGLDGLDYVRKAMDWDEETARDFIADMRAAQSEGRLKGTQVDLTLAGLLVGTRQEFEDYGYGVHDDEVPIDDENTLYSKWVGAYNRHGSKRSFIALNRYSKRANWVEDHLELGTKRLNDARGIRNEQALTGAYGDLAAKLRTHINEVHGQLKKKVDAKESLSGEEKAQWRTYQYLASMSDFELLHKYLTLRHLAIPVPEYQRDAEPIFVLPEMSEIADQQLQDRVNGQMAMSIGRKYAEHLKKQALSVADTAQIEDEIRRTRAQRLQGRAVRPSGVSPKAFQELAQVVAGVDLPTQNKQVVMDAIEGIRPVDDAMVVLTHPDVANRPGMKALRGVMALDLEKPAVKQFARELVNEASFSLTPADAKALLADMEIMEDSDFRLIAVDPENPVVFRIDNPSFPHWAAVYDSDADAWLLNDSDLVISYGRPDPTSAEVRNAITTRLEKMAKGEILPRQLTAERKEGPRPEPPPIWAQQLSEQVGQLLEVIRQTTTPPARRPAVRVDEADEPFVEEEGDPGGRTGGRERFDRARRRIPASVAALDAAPPTLFEPINDPSSELGMNEGVEVPVLGQRTDAAGVSDIEGVTGYAYDFRLTAHRESVAITKTDKQGEKEVVVGRDKIMWRVNDGNVFYENSPDEPGPHGAAVQQAVLDSAVNERFMMGDRARGVEDAKTTTRVQTSAQENLAESPDQLPATSTQSQEIQDENAEPVDRSPEEIGEMDVTRAVDQRRVDDPMHAKNIPDRTYTPAPQNTLVGGQLREIWLATGSGGVQAFQEDVLKAPFGGVVIKKKGAFAARDDADLSHLGSEASRAAQMVRDADAVIVIRGALADEWDPLRGYIMRRTHQQGRTGFYPNTNLRGTAGHNELDVQMNAEVRSVDQYKRAMIVIPEGMERGAVKDVILSFLATHSVETLAIVDTSPARSTTGKWLRTKFRDGLTDALQLRSGPMTVSDRGTTHMEGVDHVAITNDPANWRQWEATRTKLINEEQDLREGKRKQATQILIPELAERLEDLKIRQDTNRRGDAELMRVTERKRPRVAAPGVAPTQEEIDWMREGERIRARRGRSQTRFEFEAMERPDVEPPAPRRISVRERTPSEFEERYLAAPGQTPQVVGEPAAPRPARTEGENLGVLPSTLGTEASVRQGVSDLELTRALFERQRESFSLTTEAIENAPDIETQNRIVQATVESAFNVDDADEQANAVALSIATSGKVSFSLQIAEYPQDASKEEQFNFLKKYIGKRKAMVVNPNSKYISGFTVQKKVYGERKLGKHTGMPKVIRWKPKGAPGVIFTFRRDEEKEHQGMDDTAYYYNVKVGRKSVGHIVLANKKEFDRLSTRDKNYVLRGLKKARKQTPAQAAAFFVTRSRSMAKGVRSKLEQIVAQRFKEESSRKRRENSVELRALRKELNIRLSDKIPDSFKYKRGPTVYEINYRPIFGRMSYVLSESEWDPIEQRWVPVITELTESEARAYHQTYLEETAAMSVEEIQRRIDEIEAERTNIDYERYAQLAGIISELPDEIAKRIRLGKVPFHPLNVEQQEGWDFYTELDQQIRDRMSTKEYVDLLTSMVLSKQLYSESVSQITIDTLISQLLDTIVAIGKMYGLNPGEFGVVAIEEGVNPSQALLDALPDAIDEVAKAIRDGYVQTLPGMPSQLQWMKSVDHWHTFEAPLRELYGYETEDGSAAPISKQRFKEIYGVTQKQARKLLANVTPWRARQMSEADFWSDLVEVLRESRGQGLLIDRAEIRRIMGAMGETTAGRQFIFGELQRTGGASLAQEYRFVDVGTGELQDTPAPWRVHAADYRDLLRRGDFGELEDTQPATARTLVQRWNNLAVLQAELRELRRRDWEAAHSSDADTTRDAAEAYMRGERGSQGRTPSNYMFPHEVYEDPQAPPLPDGITLPDGVKLIESSRELEEVGGICGHCTSAYARYSWKLVRGDAAFVYFTDESGFSKSVIEINYPDGGIVQHQGQNNIAPLTPETRQEGQRIARELAAAWQSEEQQERELPALIVREEGAAPVPVDHNRIREIEAELQAEREQALPRAIGGIAFSLQRSQYSPTHNQLFDRISANISDTEVDEAHDKILRYLGGDASKRNWIFNRFDGTEQEFKYFEDISDLNRERKENGVTPDPRGPDVPVTPEQLEFDMDFSLYYAQPMSMAEFRMRTSGDQGLQRLLIDSSRKGQVEYIRHKTEGVAMRRLAGEVDPLVADPNETEEHAVERRALGHEALEAIKFSIEKTDKIIRETKWEGKDKDAPFVISRADSVADVKRRYNEFHRDPDAYDKLEREARRITDNARDRANAWLKTLSGKEWISYYTNYVKHLYDFASTAKDREEFEELERQARTIAEEAASAKSRRFDTYELAAKKKGWVPRAITLADLHEQWGRDVWKVAVKRYIMSNGVTIRGADGDLEMIVVPEENYDGDQIVSDRILREMAQHLAHQSERTIKPGQATDDVVRQLVSHYTPGNHDYERLDSPFASIKEIWVKKGLSANVMKQVVDSPWEHSVAKHVERYNAWTKTMSLLFSFFFPASLMESAVSAYGWQKFLASPSKFWKLLQEYKRYVREHPEYFSEWIGSGMTAHVGAPDIATGIADKDLEWSIANADGSWYSSFKPAIENFYKWKKKWDNWLWNEFHPAVKLMTANTVLSELEQNFKERGIRYDRDVIMEDISRYVNNAFGGQEWTQYPWSTPKLHQALHWAWFAKDWSLSAANVAGITQFIPGLRELVRTPFSAIERDQMARVYWPTMAGLVLVGLPNMVQLALYAGMGDPDEGDVPFTFMNEQGKKTHIDITPLLRKFGWVPAIGYDGGDSGKRRVYMRWGKQAYEVFDGWMTRPQQTFINKTSIAVKTLLEQITGQNTVGWELPFNGEGPIGLIYADRSIWKSRAGYIARKYVPMSILSVLDGRPTSFFAPASRGMNMGMAVDRMRRVLDAYADPGVWAQISGRGERLNRLEELTSITIEAAIKNGVNPEEAFKRAKSLVLGDYYKQFFRALNKKQAGKMDVAAEAVLRLQGKASGIEQSLQRRLAAGTRELTPEDQALVEGSLIRTGLTPQP